MEIYKITKNGLSFSRQDEDSSIPMESCFDFLKREMREIDRYSDRSLLFQNYAIIDKWLDLVDIIGKNDLWTPSQDEIQDMQRTNTRLMYICIQLRFISDYEILYEKYNRQLENILREHKKWKTQYCISYKAIHTLSADNYGQNLDIDNINQYLGELKEDSIKARSALYDAFSKYQRILLAVMNRGLDIVTSHRPTYGELRDAFEVNPKVWTD